MTSVTPVYYDRRSRHMMPPIFISTFVFSFSFASAVSKRNTTTFFLSTRQCPNRLHGRWSEINMTEINCRSDLHHCRSGNSLSSPHTFSHCPSPKAHIEAFQRPQFAVIEARQGTKSTCRLIQIHPLEVLQTSQSPRPKVYQNTFRLTTP